MDTQLNSSTQSQNTSDRIGTLVGGGLLALFGALILVDKFFDLGRIMLIYPGLAMFAIGIVKRSSGWMIPAGIMSGIALGVILEGSVVTGPLATNSGLFLLGFALGWISIPLFSRAFGKEKNDWAFIPGALLTLVGAGFLVGNNFVSISLSVPYIVPVAMILVGLALLVLKRSR